MKRGPQGETVYVNQFFTQRPGANGTKHVYAGTTRIVSKLMKQDTPGANPQGNTPFEKDLYFYHPDHLGTSNYITDTKGKLYEHLEYFPFGEAWVEENRNTQRTPYLFTAKELDEETGLYYFGARYYDPRTSVWQSADPILEKYLDGAGGGLGQPVNFAAYSYGRNNPIAYKDPDGNIVFLAAVPFVLKGLAVAGAAITGYEIGTAGYEIATGEKSATQVAKERAPGVAIGIATGGAGKLGLKLVPKSVKEEVANVVFRALRKGEDPSKGLRARSPGQATKPESHIMGKRDSDLISTTKDPNVAREINTRGDQAGVVEIDLNKVKGEVIDVSEGTGRGRVFSYSKSKQEVLIRDPGGANPPIPPEAIKVIE